MEEANMYLCDPAKNKECWKTNCLYKGWFCFLTSRPECAIDGSNPIDFDKDMNIIDPEGEE